MECGMYDFRARGSSEISVEYDDKPVDDLIYNEFNKHGAKMMEELGINMKISASECGNMQCLECRDIWFNKYHKTHSQEIHWHVHNDRDVLFSFAYFAKFDPEKDAKFKFINPMPSEITNETLREHPAFAFDITPDVEEGDILIFPSFLLHRVEEQLEDRQRITISGNFYEQLKEEIKK